jgi:transglutaminase-like putative cysteine protease
MTWRTRIEHHSDYEYAGVVQSSLNEARITPLTTPSQTVLESTVEVHPATSLYRYTDYWGSVVHAFELSFPHREMTVVGRSLVETVDPHAAEEPVGWRALHGDAVRDRFAELLAPSMYVPTDPRLAEVAWGIHLEHPPDEAAAVAVAWVRDQLRYVAGTTGVHTSAVEAWDGGEGVCQDFAHLALAVVRAMGLPARYCSGYLHPDPGATVGPTVDGQSHAWLEVWCGGWRALDPTNGSRVGERHVLVARGRDYSDVSPVKGIFHGGPTSRLRATVRLTRIL